MQHSFCLNCATEVSQKFCPNCGQKTDTHRITLKHFVLHDLLHGVWHIERGIVFTIKEAIVRPGQAALDYIGGKRIRYYNVFYLCLLVIALNILLVHFYNGFAEHENEAPVSKINVFFADNLKFILLGIVPIFAINGYFVFRRMKQNLAEHFIISGMALLGILILSIPFFFIKFLESYTQNTILSFAKIFAFFLMVAFPIWSYRNATKSQYGFWAFAFRILVFYTLVLLQFFLIVTAIVFSIANKSDLQINI